MTSKAIVYSSQLGKTRKTAKYIAKELNADLFDLKKQTIIDLSEYDHIIFGTGIHAGKPYRTLVSFLQNNKGQLSNKKRSLFLCCKLNDEKGDKQIKQVSEGLEIEDAYYFSSSGEKNEEGFSVVVDEFVKEMRKR